MDKVSFCLIDRVYCDAANSPPLSLLDLECGLDDDDNNEWHPPRRFQLGRGVDRPLHDSARGDVGNGVVRKETPVRLHLFLFPSGTRKEEVKK